MEAIEEPTTIPVEGSPEGTGSQPTEPISKDTALPEETGQRQVDTPKSEPTSQPQARRASEYYAGRKRFQQLEETVNQIRDTLLKQSQTQTQPPPAAKPDYESMFYKDPVGTMQQMIRDIANGTVTEAVSKVKEDISSERAKTELQKAQQEVEKIVFAKSKEFNDPQFFENLGEIVEKYGLAEWAKKDCLAATNAAIDLYVQLKRNGTQKSEPLRATKASMASTSSGILPTKTKPGTAEIQKLFDELQKDKSLVNDPEWNKKWAAIQAEIKK